MSQDDKLGEALALARDEVEMAERAGGIDDCVSVRLARALLALSADRRQLDDASLAKLAGKPVNVFGPMSGKEPRTMALERIRDEDLTADQQQRIAAAALNAPASSDLPSNGAIAHTYGKLKAALTELLRLYDWRNELGRIERDFNHDKKQMTTWLNQYGREKKQAWAVARDTLAGAPDIDALLLHERIQIEAQARVAAASATSAQLLEALRVALGESSSMTLPEVRALLARSEGRDA